MTRCRHTWVVCSTCQQAFYFAGTTRTDYEPSRALLSAKPRPKPWAREFWLGLVWLILMATLFVVLMAL